MKKYFYSDGSTQSGPFTIDELGGHFITAETLIWYEGAAGWLPASQLPELSGLFPAVEPKPAPPPVGQQTNYTPPVPQAGPMDMGMGRQQLSYPPKTWLVESILVTLFCCMPFGIAGIVYASKVESKFYAGDQNGAQLASAEAAKWTKIGLWVGVGCIVLYLIFVFGMVGTAMMNGGLNN